jgi:hypothetical protein
MDENDDCPICKILFGENIKVEEIVKSKSMEKRWNCPNAGKCSMKHVFSFDGKLYHGKRIRTTHICPVCGHMSNNLVPALNNGFSCDVCSTIFNLDGSIRKGGKIKIDDITW